MKAIKEVIESVLSGEVNVEFDKRATSRVADEVLASIEAAGYAIVPIKASPGLLVSMATRYDHSFGIDKVDHSVFKLGYTNDERLSLVGTMRQLHEEVVGSGFYQQSKEALYKDAIKNWKGDDEDEA